MQVKHKLYLNFFVILMFFTMLAGTTYAMFSTLVKIENNKFKSAEVKINFNNDEKLFADNIAIVPGDKIVSPLTIINTGSVDVYYKLYFTNVIGELKAQAIINIYVEDKLVHHAPVSSFNENNAYVSETVLNVDESITYLVEIELLTSADNYYQNQSLTFDIACQAVQARNNVNKLFPQ